MRRRLGRLCGFALLLALPALADTAKPVHVASSVAWVTVPAAFDYGATAYCLSARPDCRESNALVKPWFVAGSLAVQVWGDRWLSKHSRPLMWATRVLRIAYHGVLAARAVRLGARRGR